MCRDNIIEKDKLKCALNNVFDNIVVCRKLTDYEKLIRNLQKAAENILIAINRASRDQR